MQSYECIQDSQLMANLMNLISAHLYENYNNTSQDINCSAGKGKDEFQNILCDEFLPN